MIKDMLREYFAELGALLFFLLFIWTLYSEYTDRSYSCLFKLIRMLLAFVFIVLSALCLRHR